MQYNYPPGGSNNGQVLSTNDNISGEGVGYMYDSLKRLIAAQAGSWGESYSYDGFGNLTAKTPTMGSAPALSVSYNAATNQPTSGGYDANGNAPVTGGVWDAENHMVQQTLDGVALNWAYDPSGRRVLQYQQATGRWTFYIYGAGGQLLGQIACTPSGSTCAAQRANVYFGGQLIARMENQSGTMTPRGVVMDRLGTVRAVQTSGGWSTPTYFPYGEPKTGTGIDGREQFATYQRDSTASAQDYAMQRYYSNNTGRFLSPDPTGLGSVNTKSPSTWNLYAFNLGDPVNRSDKTGTISCLDWFNALAANGLIDGEVLGNADFDSMFGNCESEGDAQAANAGVEFDPCSIASDSGAHALMDYMGLSCGGGLMFGATATIATGEDDGGDGGDGGDDPWDGPELPQGITDPGAPPTSPGGGGALGRAGQTLWSSHGLALALDLTGYLLPEEALAGQVLVGAASVVVSAGHGDAGGAVGGIAGIHVASMVPVGKAMGWGRTLPRLGQAIAAIGGVEDFKSAYEAYESCMGSHK